MESTSEAQGLQHPKSKKRLEFEMVLAKARQEHEFELAKDR